MAINEQDTGLIMEKAETPFYLQSFRKRYKHILKLYEILKKQNKQTPLVTLVYEMHGIALKATDREKELTEALKTITDKANTALQERKILD